MALHEHPERDPAAKAAAYVDAGKGVPDAKAALDGARQILMERFAEDAELLGRLRRHLQENAVLTSVVVKDMRSEGQKFRDYFEYAEPLNAVPPHRALALFRGRKEGVLKIALKQPEELAAEGGQPLATTTAEAMIAKHFDIRDAGRPADAWLKEAVRCTWRVKLSLHLELELLNALFERAEAIRVFAANLKDLLLAASAGPRVVIGLDPGIRTGVKLACVDRTGKLLDTATIYPFEPRNDREGALETLAGLARRHEARLIAIGNGTASRETDRLVAQLIRCEPALKLTKVVVNEAGASVYSASELAAREFPDLDVSLRGAVSIARRLQDPWPSWSRSSPGPSVWASISTTSARANSRMPWMRWSRTVSTPSAWT